MKKRINQTLMELWIGEVVFGFLCQVVGLFFVSQKGYFSIGLWIGVATAVINSYHMWYSLDLAMELSKSDAEKLIGSRYMLRYLILILVLALTYYLKIGNVFAAFLGYMGMKFAAYIQPFVHKIFFKGEE